MPIIKITIEQAKVIIERYRSGDYTQAQLAAEYGISVAQVCRINRGKRWGVLGIARCPRRYNKTKEPTNE